MFNWSYLHQILRNVACRVLLSAALRASLLLRATGTSPEADALRRTLAAGAGCGGRASGRCGGGAAAAAVSAAAAAAACCCGGQGCSYRVVGRQSWANSVWAAAAAAAAAAPPPPPPDADPNPNQDATYELPAREVRGVRHVRLHPPAPERAADHRVGQHGQSAPWAAPQLGSCRARLAALGSSALRKKPAD
eukprot:scaffold13855_cov48-Phaeocystis_antarctica.AAC.3